MSDARDVLDRIEVASPCTQDWNAMTGDEKRRYCGECRLHVHDLSAMTRDEAEEVLRGADGRLCVRFYRRPDGRVLTKDCITVRDRLRRRVRRLRVAAAALFAFLSPFVSGCGASTTSGNGGGEGGSVTTPEHPPMMGDIAVEPATLGDPDGDGGGDTDPDEIEPLMGEVYVEPQELLGRVKLPTEPAKDDDAE